MALTNVRNSRAQPDEDMAIDDRDYERLAALIHSDASPVGIDAKKTHVLILHKLEQIERRLAALETRATEERAARD